MLSFMGYISSPKNLSSLQNNVAKRLLSDIDQKFYLYHNKISMLLVKKSTSK